jgi:hypothetical protein
MIRIYDELLESELSGILDSRLSARITTILKYQQKVT